MTVRHGLLLAAIAAALCACKANSSEPGAAPSTAPAAAGRSVAGLELVPLEIRSKGRTHRFTVEIARTEEEQARGLMFRPEIGADEGMIFPFDPPRPASFWMKNTMTSLDLLFVRADGTIARIAADATPYSLDSISVGEPVAAVLEIAGGRAAELGIASGDVVNWTGQPAR